MQPFQVWIYIRLMGGANKRLVGIYRYVLSKKDLYSIFIEVVYTNQIRAFLHRVSIIL
jgi:hypothetical protein